MAKPPTINHQLQLPVDAIGFDPVGFDNLIRSQGVEVIHYRALRCPVGMVDPDDIRRPHDHHENCSNGMIYVKAGVVTIGFTGNSTDVRFMDAGRLDGGQVTGIIPRFYDDNDAVRVELCEFDRIYLNEPSVTVATKQTFAADITGIDKLRYPVVHVSDMIDADGIRYTEGVDFVVRGGKIHWGANQPGQDTKLQRGKVCSVRFTYIPFYYVKSLSHDTRVARIVDEYTLESRVEVMQQTVSLQRELWFEKEQQDREAPASPRQQPLPDDGSFGPR